MRSFGVAMTMLAVMLLLAPRLPADDELAEKRRAVRAEAEALVRGSGPVQQRPTPLMNTPPEWRPGGQIVGDYFSHADRIRYTAPTVPFFIPYGYPYWCGVRGFGHTRGVGIWGYSTW